MTALLEVEDVHVRFRVGGAWTRLMGSGSKKTAAINVAAIVNVT